MAGGCELDAAAFLQGDCKEYRFCADGGWVQKGEMLAGSSLDSSGCEEISASVTG